MKSKSEKGITLIALVITIIVLLILVGVSIAMLTGDNGILTKSTESKEETYLAEVLERVNMELNAQLTNAMAGDAFDSETTINKNLEGIPEGYKVEVTSDSTEYSTSNDVTITISDDPDSDVKVKVPGQASGSVTYEGNSWKVTPVKAEAEPTT